MDCLRYLAIEPSLAQETAVFFRSNEPEPRSRDARNRCKTSMARILAAGLVRVCPAGPRGVAYGRKGAPPVARDIRKPLRDSAREAPSRMR